MSLTGRLLAIGQRAPAWSAWVEDGLLRPGSAQLPGANGIKVNRGWAWVSVTDRNAIAAFLSILTAGPANSR